MANHHVTKTENVETQVGTNRYQLASICQIPPRMARFCYNMLDIPIHLVQYWQLLLIQSKSVLCAQTSPDDGQLPAPTCLIMHTPLHPQKTAS